MSIRFKTPRVAQQNQERKSWVPLQKGQCDCACGRTFETFGTVEEVDKYVFLRTKDTCPKCGLDNMAVEFRWE